MNDVNHFTCTGHAVEHADQKPAGATRLAVVRIVINRERKIGDKWEREPGVFVNIVCFGWIADVAIARVRKGTKLFIDGRLQLREWESEGQRRSALEIVAERLEIIDVPDRGQRTSTDYASTDDDERRSRRGTFAGRVDEGEADIPF